MSAPGGDPRRQDRGAGAFAELERILAAPVRRLTKSAVDDRSRERAESHSSQRLLLAESERDAVLCASRAKDDFLADLAHELLSPLQAMVGWLSLLRARRLDAELQERALDVIERNLKAQASLIFDLLDVSRIAAGELTLTPSLVDLATIVRNAVEDQRPVAASRRVALEGPSGAEPLIVHGDANRLAQVVTNLLTNAVKFTPGGGAVRVALLAESAGVVLEVRDTGQGIAPELLPHVFDRLRQGECTGSRRGSLGLGLAIAKHLVEQHGGSISAESEGDGRGSLFRVTLPRGGPSPKDIPAAR